MTTNLYVRTSLNLMMGKSPLSKHFVLCELEKTAAYTHTANVRHTGTWKSSYGILHTYMT